MSTRKLHRTQTWLFEHRRTARRQSQGRRWTRNPADERSTAVLLGQGEWHTSQQIVSTHRLSSTIEGEWSEIEMCAEGWRICANTFSIVSAWTIAVCSMVRSSSGKADTSYEMFVRLPKGQEREGWIWRFHGAMNGIRTVSRGFTEFLTGILTEHMDFKRDKLERCLIVHESNETRVLSHVDDPLICAKPATLEKFWTQITKLVIKRGGALNPRIPVTYLGFE